METVQPFASMKKLLWVGAFFVLIVALSAQTAPVFVVQPSNVSIGDGGSFTLSATVNTSNTTERTDLGFGFIVDLPVPAGVSWKLNLGSRTLNPSAVASAQVNNRITVSLSFGPVSLADAGSFRLVATNVFGATLSDSKSLTVTPVAPSISTQPANQAVTVGGTATLSVTASGTAPLVYQWRKDGTPISGATSASLTLNSVQASNAGSYTVSVSNGLGTVNSTGATLTVNVTIPPTISIHPASQSVSAGANVALTVAATGTAPLSYQWRKDGAPIAGATNATFTLTSVQTGDAGEYAASVLNTAGSVSSGAALLTVAAFNPGRLVNMSIRTTAGTGAATLIVGVGIGGAGSTGNKAVLIRGVGPTLGAFGVGGALSDPIMTMFRNAAQVAQNDDWSGGFDFASVGAFGFSGAMPRDAAIYSGALLPGSYSIQIAGKSNGTGIALAEIYDATPSTAFTPSTPRLVNVSARTNVGTGDAILIAGFVIGGETPVRILVRAVGPTLASFGVTDVLPDPKLEVFRSQTKVAENDNWGGNNTTATVFNTVGAFPLSAPTSRDAALVVTLQPGTYTAQVTGAGGTTGVALIEIYEVP